MFSPTLVFTWKTCTQFRSQTRSRHSSNTLCNIYSRLHFTQASSLLGVSRTQADSLGMTGNMRSRTSKHEALFKRGPWPNDCISELCNLMQFCMWWCLVRMTSRMHTHITACRMHHTSRAFSNKFDGAYDAGTCDERPLTAEACESVTRRAVTC